MATGGEETITGGGDDGGGAEIVLFGVRVVVDSMRKSVSLNNLSQYEPPNAASSSNHNDAAEGAVAAGYVSADDVVAHRSNNRERKRGIPWSEEEHKRFLIGLKKLGKGDWRGIAKNFVLTRTPTQVASHAQKYYIRRSNVSRRRRRSSLFDITTDSVVAVPTNNQETTQDEASQSRSLVSTQTTSNRSQISTPPTIYPLAIGAPVDNRIDYKHFLPTQAAPVPTKPLRTTPADFDIDMNSGIAPFLSLNLSLSSSSSSDQGSSSRQQHSGFHIILSPRASSIMGIA